MTQSTAGTTTTDAAGPVVTSTTAKIEALGVADLPQAAVALALAARIDSPRETGAAVAALAKQHAAMLADLEKRGRRAVDPLDELRERRKRKAASA